MQALYLLIPLAEFKDCSGLEDEIIFFIAIATRVFYYTVYEPKEATKSCNEIKLDSVALIYI